MGRLSTQTSAALNNRAQISLWFANDGVLHVLLVGLYLLSCGPLFTHAYASSPLSDRESKLQARVSDQQLDKLMMSCDDACGKQASRFLTLYCDCPQINADTKRRFNSQERMKTGYKTQRRQRKEAVGDWLNSQSDPTIEPPNFYSTLEKTMDPDLLQNMMLNEYMELSILKNMETNHFTGENTEEENLSDLLAQNDDLERHAHNTAPTDMFSRDLAFLHFLSNLIRQSPEVVRQPSLSGLTKASKRDSYAKRIGDFDYGLSLPWQYGSEQAGGPGVDQGKKVFRYGRRRRR